MKRLLPFLIVLLALFTTENAQASHVGGGYFYYSCISGNQYQITFVFWRDCDGISAPASITAGFTSACGGTATAFLSQQSSQTVEVSQLCPTALPNSTCNNGFLPGYQQYVYTGTVTLNPPCSTWTMSHSISARNPVTNLSISGNAYWYGTLNNVNAGCPNNNSPIFTSQPIPYYCTGQQVQFNPGVIEPDGDSLSFSLVSALTSATGTANYGAGFSPTNPFGAASPVTFSNSTGQMSFVPTTPGNYVVVIEVCEYRNGVQLGCVMREFQIVIQTCNNSSPYMPFGISNFQGSGTVLDSNSLLVCVGDSFSFDVLFVDTLVANQTIGDSITILTNAGTVLPGATVTTINGDSAILTVSWLTSPGSPVFNNFIVEIEDDACPINGLGIYQFDIAVIPATYAGPDITLCGYDDSAFVNVVGGDTFTWNLLSGDPLNFGVNIKDTIGTDGNNMWFKPDSSSTYEVTSNLSSQCLNKDTLNINVRQIDVGPDTALCRGDTMTMGLNLAGTIPCASGTENYFWSPTIGLSNPNARNPLLTVQPGQLTTMYTVVYDDGCGCLTADSFLIEVSDIAEPTTTWQKLNCGIDDGVIDVTANQGFAPYLYSIDNGASYDTATVFDSLAIGYYDVLVQDSLGCISPLHIDTVLDPNTPIIDSVQISDVTCFGAQNGVIEVFASGGTAPYTYSNDSSLTFQTNNIFSGLSPDTFYIGLEDAGLCKSIPAPYVVNTNNQMQVDSVIIKNLDCYDDGSGEIALFGSGGTAPLSYSIDNGVTYQATGQFVGLSAGSYVAIIMDSIGCTTTPQIIDITQPTRINVNMNIDHDTCYDACGGKATATVSGGSVPYTFNWYGYGSNGNTSNNLCAGTYQFRVIDNINCVFDTAYVINQPTELVIDSIISDDISCNGLADGQISILASGGTPPYKYSVDGGVTVSSSNNFSALSKGTYDVMVFDSAQRCMDITTVTLNEPSPVVLTAATNSTKICVSTCANLSASASGGTGAPYTYFWQGLNGNVGTVPACPDNDTVYSVYATDVNGCVSNVELIQVTLYDSLSVHAGGAAIICPGEETEISAIATGGNAATGYNYYWSPVPSLSNPYTATTTAGPNATTTYEVKLTDGCGTPAVTDTVTVTVSPLPQPDFQALTPISGCEPVDVVLENLTAPAQFVEWNIGEAITASGFVVDLLDLTEGEYDVTMTVTSPDGCVESVTKRGFINVNPIPEADFSMTPNPTTIFNTTIQFQNLSSIDSKDYTWDFAGFATSDEKNPIYQFPADTGSYVVELTSVTDSGCVDTHEGVLRIGDEYNFYIPNSFTPNGDGLNDIFKVEAIGVDLNNFDMKVYDRWGQEVFATTDLASGWDGSINGSTSTAPNGIYVWKITLKDAKDSKSAYEYTGTVNLIR